MSGGGAVIMSVFAAIWWVAGMRASGRGSALLYAIATLVTGVIIALAWLRWPGTASEAPEETARQARQGRLVGIASGAEGLAILIAVNVLVNIGQADFIAPVIAMIVGLHFLPLAHGLPAPSYYGTSALLLALGVCSLVIPDASQRTLTVSVGAAAILWLTSALALGHSWRQR